MTKHNQDGAISGVGISLGIAIVLLIGMIVFGVWAYSGKLDYKNNVDAKISVASAAVKQQEDAAQAKIYAEKEKQPLVTYQGPESSGSIVMNYPKTWSGYVDASGTAADSVLIDGYLSPGVVPSLLTSTSTYAVRFQVVNKTYSDVVNGLSDAQQAKDITVAPYTLPKVPKNSGVEVTGKLSDTKTGTMVIVPLRAQTIKVWTEGTQFVGDFNTYILPNFSFSP